MLAGGITFSLIHWSNTSHYRELKTRPGTPQVARAPVHVAFTPTMKKDVLAVAAEFVNTAVKRRHVEKSFDLATPTLRAGYTRHAWATTDIPVVPYPLDFAKYRVKGSFADSVWLQVAVFPDKAHKQVPAAVFDLVLKPFGQKQARHWLVDSWAPAGYTSIPSGPLGEKPTAMVEYKSPVSSWWVFLPLSAFGLGLVLLASVAVRGWWRNARAVKRYKSTYQ
ncbi:MAG: hypothetical protein ACYDA3_11230 [Gaiellaceae bacterium]